MSSCFRSTPRHLAAVLVLLAYVIYRFHEGRTRARRARRITTMIEVIWAVCP